MRLCRDACVGEEHHERGQEDGADDFYIEGDINIELELETTGEDLQWLDGTEWYGMHGPECRGGGEDVITFDKKKLWW